MYCANKIGHKRSSKVKTLNELYGKTKGSEFLSWGLDILIAFIVAELLSNLNGPYFIEKMLLSHLTTFIGGLVYLWIVSVFINTPMLLLTGLSYGEYISGLRVKSKFEIGSLIGLSRFSLRFVIGPCPRLAHKIFSNQVSIEPTVNKKKIAYVVFVLLLLTSLIAPMVRSLRYGGAIVRQDQSFTLNNTKVDGQDIEAELRLSSQRLHFVNKLEKSFFKDWILLPRFDLIKSDKSSILSSYLYILSKNTLEESYLERSRKVNISQLLSKAFKSHNHLTNQKENLQEDILKTKDQKWSAAGKEELKDLFHSSLTFGSSVKKHLINQITNGPFSSGHHSLRAEIKKVIPLTEIETFSFIKLGHHSFILFSGLFDKTKCYSFFSLEEKKPYVYSLTWNGAIDSRDHFMNSFFKKVSWEFTDDTNFWSYPSEISDITVTHLMDMLIEKKLSKEHQNTLEVSLYMYYFSLYKESLIASNEKIKNIVTSELNKTDRIIKLKKSNLTPVFVARWNSLVANAMSTNKKYFGVE